MRRSLVAVIVAAVVCSIGLVAVGAAVADADTDQESLTTLTVTLVDSDGERIANTDVVASWEDDSRTATTAANGRVFIDVPEGADVELDVDSDTYVRNSPLLIENAEEQDVELRVARQGSVSVTVTDTGGDPIDGASVSLRRGATTIVEGPTDADGVFESGTVERGEYRLRVVATGYFRQSPTITVGDSSTESVELERGQVELSVSVADDHFDEPRPIDTRVRISDASGEVATVRADGGSASLRVPVNNRYDVTVVGDRHQERTGSIRVVETDRSIELLTQRIPTLTAESANRRVVTDESTRVTVRNAYDEPVEGAELVVDNRTIAETGPDGTASVTVDWSGDRSIVARSDGIESEPIQIEGVDPSQADDIENGPDDGADGDIEDLNGFGAGVAILGVLLATLLLRRR